MKRIISTKPGGAGPTMFEWQRGASQYLASTGAGTMTISIADRKGNLIDNIHLTGECLHMKWSPDGDCLAAIQSKSLALVLWDATVAKGTTLIDTGMKNMESLAWSDDGDMIAVATSKGNLFVYERRTGKKIPVISKHTKAIVDLAWSSNNELACASSDRSFSISNREGDTTFQMNLKGEPENLQWAKVKQPDGSVQQTLSMTLSAKSLFIFNPSKPHQPIELAFHQKYGTIAKYSWFKDNQLIVGFAPGYIVVVTTNPSELGQEKFQSKSYKDTLSDVVVSPILNMVATCGDSAIKIHDLSNLQDVSSLITLENERDALVKLQFSDDGQFLTVSTKDGSLHTYLSKLPTLGHTWANRIAHLISLSDVAVVDYSTTPISVVKCETNSEPLFVSLGPKHLAVGVGPKIKYYCMSPAVKRPWDGIVFEYAAVKPLPPLAFTGKVWEKEYPMAVTSIVMNEQYAAILFTNGELHLHPLEESYFNAGQAGKGSLNLVFPEEQFSQTEAGAIVEITSVAMTNEFLIYGTSHGALLHYDLDEILMVNDYRHTTGITAIYPSPGLSTKVILVDDKKNAFIVSPISDAPIEIPSFPANARGVLWETAPFPGRFIFVVWDDTAVTTFVYSPLTLRGHQCRGLHKAATRLPYGLKPVLLLNGVLVCQTPGGKLESLVLATHEELGPENFLRKYPTDEDQGRALRLLYIIGKLGTIWQLYPAVVSRKAWSMLAEAALHSLDVSTAKRIYRQMLGDAGMVLNLERIEAVEERIELQGHVAVIFGDFNMAQQCFLTSSNPKEALYLRRDLLEWEQALSLANRMAPEEIPVIAREYAIQLEMDGNAADALAMYEKARSTIAQNADLSDEDRADHERVCKAGMTRMAFRTGDIARGMALLSDATDKQLLLDCAAVLESLKQLAEAAVILERGSMWERAAEIWIKLKSWSKVGKLIDKLNSSKIFLQYARAKEAEGQFLDAASAYERAKDHDNVARVLLEKLNDMEGAAVLVRKTRSRESAKMMAKAFQAARDNRAAVEFYLLAGMPNEAFEIAKSQDVVEHFAELVQDEASNELLSSIALYFETKGMVLQAGRFHLQASHYAEALKMFLQCPVIDGSSIDLAIETVGQAKNDALTHELIDFLMGETDGMPKDAKYIFKLYMSLGQFKEAARTAIIIAREEQVLGNYRAAHDLLFDNYRQLKTTKAKVPAELDRMLMLLHSYTLVKTLVRIDDHVKGARMLMRVSNNISKFPAHVVPILTSTVVECHRAGLKKAAFEYAAMLMRPEYRQKVDAKFKRKIEQIVRRPEKDEVVETMTPCPFCNNPVAETSLDCDECKNHIPYCIASGFHMVLEEWAVCPSCEFPALASHFKEMVEKVEQCPMCSAKVSPSDIVSVDNPEAYLRGKKSDIEESGVGSPVAAVVASARAGAVHGEEREKVQKVAGEASGSQDSPAQSQQRGNVGGLVV
ncbi:hypothetical protein BC831DRAFT_481578 [Entophlyctis helioformis]|nr:hypothetical protein BC831DRAFT_481578 [Entophlyctis helioformis]